MPLIIKQDGTHFEPAPGGLHRAVCVDTVDLGLVEGKFGAKHKVKLVWQLEKRNKQGERFQVRATYTASLFEGSNLRRDLEAWRAKNFTEKELASFDLEKLIGVNCRLNIKEAISKSTGRKYAQVTAVLPAEKGAVKLEAEDYEREPWADAKPAPVAPPNSDVYDVDPIDEGHAAQYDDDSVPF